LTYGWSPQVIAAMTPEQQNMYLRRGGGVHPKTGRQYQRFTTAAEYEAHRRCHRK